MEDLILLNRMIVYFEMMGAWGMAEALRKILQDLTEETGMRK